jgi:hypothetical protein
VCKAVLGPRYTLVEVGYDVPGPGRNQPWHRDLPAPEATRLGRAGRCWRGLSGRVTG